MQDIVDPFTDEMLARFVVDSHARSQPKGANLEDRVSTDVDDDPLAAARQADPDVCIPIAISTERTSYSALWF
jgi:DNA replication licensing factor MCM2